MSVKTILVNGVRCWDVDGEILPILFGGTTLAVDAPRTYELGDVNSFPVITLDIIYEGAAVGLDSAGNARPLVAGDQFVGFAESKADNSAGAAGAIRVRVRRYGLIRLPVTGVTALTDVGHLVYASDDNTFTLTESTNSVIGRLARWDVSTYCYVVFDAQAPGGGGVSGTTGLQIADVAAATAAALTDNSGGAASATLASISDTATKNAVASLAAQVNALIVDVAAIRTAINAAI